MALLQRLAAEHLRNLETFSLRPHPRYNLVYGRNASGKTSLLEAVHIAGQGRSFRGPLRQVVRHQEGIMRLHAEIQGADGAVTAVAIEHRAGRTSLAANGGALRRSSELAQLLPVLLINTDSHNVIAGGPQQRRRMLDWGVFHVEHRYGAMLSRYQNALRQRNLCLQDGPRATVPAHVWNDELAAGADQIDGLRRRYVEQWLPHVEAYVARLLGGVELTIAYQPGWDAARALQEVLREGEAADRQAGYTRSGPHRANLEISVGGVPAEHRLSRGQQKLLVFALAFAQAEALRAHRGDAPVLLIDDLAAELDAEHRADALAVLDGLASQAFVSVTEATLLPAPQAREGAVFHVEHGRIEEML